MTELVSLQLASWQDRANNKRLEAILCVVSLTLLRDRPPPSRAYLTPVWVLVTPRVNVMHNAQGRLIFLQGRLSEQCFWQKSPRKVRLKLFKVFQKFRTFF